MIAKWKKGLCDGGLFDTSEEWCPCIAQAHESRLEVARQAGLNEAGIAPPPDMAEIFKGCSSHLSDFDSHKFMAWRGHRRGGG